MVIICHNMGLAGFPIPNDHLGMIGGATIYGHTDIMVIWNIEQWIKLETVLSK